MTEHLSIERMHDLLDAELSVADEREVKRHVQVCDSCAATLAEVSAVVEDLGRLPADAEVPEDLWPDIEARIGSIPVGEAADPDVIPFPSAFPRSGRRRFSFSVPQLAAAATVVAFLSAGTMWMATAGDGGSPTTSTAVRASGDPSTARLVAAGDVGYEEAVSELEQVIDRGRDLLAPETIATLERSLGTIDEALAEVREALRRDPASPVLARMLVSHQRSRIRLLRQAAISIQART